MKNILLIALLFCLAGCGTIKGIGEDITAIGGWFTRGSDSVQDNIGGD
ncbi:MAG: hypothetical protein KAR05_03045 [Candidatus Omnitrophica bacterium]|nr:hypothetical protein [Candidatus Omnitrophota bacterium]